MSEKCGYLNRHWYCDGEPCVCGQIPEEIFFAVSCDCGGYRLRKPVHNPNCSYIAWAKKRNEWIREHPGLKPPLDYIPITTRESRVEILH